MTEPSVKKTSEPPDGAAPHKKKKGNPWVDNIESLVVAVVLALIIRTFVVEAFVIPTGSMALSLWGNHFNLTCPNCGYRYAVGYDETGRSPLHVERVLCPNCGVRIPVLPTSYAGGDRILVNKVLYKFDEARRWDPLVFVNPKASWEDNPPKTTYIKRLVGLPGEALEILRGDVVVNGVIQRKPPAAQSRLWMPVYDMGYAWKEGKPWYLTGKGWSFQDKRLAADPGAELAWAQYAGRIGKEFGMIRDDYSYDQDRTVKDAPYVNHGSGLNVVTDLRVSFDLKAGASGRLIVSLVCDDVDDRATLNFAAGDVTLSRGEPAANPVKEEILACAPVAALADNAMHRVTFYRLDYRLVLAIDGTDTVEYDLWSEDEYRRMAERGREYLRLIELGRRPDASETLEGHTRSGVRLGAADARLVLSGLRIDRDVYYTYPRQNETGGNHYFDLTGVTADGKIPQGCYFAMGDNSPESYDGRYWGVVPADHLIGKPLAIWWHPLRVRLIH